MSWEVEDTSSIIEGSAYSITCVGMVIIFEDRVVNVYTLCQRELRKGGAREMMSESRKGNDFSQNVENGEGGLCFFKEMDSK